MSIAIDELIKLLLPQRLEIVERLWDSIAADPERLPVTAKQAEELDRRSLCGPGDGYAAPRFLSSSRITRRNVFSIGSLRCRMYSRSALFIIV